MRLNDGEELVTTVHPHPRVLVWPILALLVLAALVGVGLAAVPPAYRPVGQQVVAGLGAVLALVLVGRPVLRWATTSTTVTTQRLITRSGVLRRAGNDLPLNRVVDVGYHRRSGDLGFGSGTLLLTTLSGHLFHLDNLPRIKDVYQAVSELVADVGPDSQPEEERWR